MTNSLYREKSSWRPQISDDYYPNNIVASKYFGNPVLLNGESWPQLEGEDAKFILQLKIDTLPSPIASLLGGKGLLQFFLANEVGYGDDSYYLLRIIQEEEGSSNTPQPNIENIEFPKDLSQKVISAWLEHQEWPHGQEFFASYEDNDAEEKDYPYEGDKLGGWAFWTQGNETPEDSNGEPMIMIYQLNDGYLYDEDSCAYATNLFSGDGTGHIFVSKTNPHELVFWWAAS